MGINRLMARLRVYAPNGALTGSLPHPLSWEAGVPLNDMPSLTLTYPERVSTTEALLSPCEVALELMDPRTGEYAEHPGCRYLNLRRSRDLLERPGTVSFTMPSYGWQLRKVRFADPAKLNDDNRIHYQEVTVGRILRDVLDESKSRGNIPAMGYTFTADADSNGTPWPDVITGDYDLGADAWGILDALSGQGLVDWRFNGRDLELYVADTYLKRNLATDGGVIFHSHADGVEEPTDRTWEEVAPTLLVLGDEGSSLLLTADPATTDSPWGAWEESYSAGGVQDEGTLRLMGSQVQATRSKSRLQITKQLAWRTGAPVPLADYTAGDMVMARDDLGTQNEPLRIHQVTLSSQEPYGISISLTLNDRFMERALKTERWLNRVTSRGGPVEGGGTGSTTTPKTPDPSGEKPAVPTGLTVASQSYFSETGDPVGQAMLTFDVVTTDINGKPSPPSRYLVYARRDDLPFDLSIQSQVEHPDDAVAGDRLTAYLGPLDAGHLYHFSVAALNAGGHPGQWAAPVSLVISLPTDPAPVPSAPVLSSRLSTVKVEWDGLSELYEVDMPPRFREVQVEMSVTGGSPWTHIGEIFQGGSALIVTGQDSQQNWGVGDTLYFRFRSRDSAGNISDPSDISSIVVTGIEGPDIEANSITANLIAAGAITAEKVAAHSLSVDRLSVSGQTNLIVDPQFTDDGDPDPDNPGQTIGGLNRHRLDVANISGSAGGSWSLSSDAAVFTREVSSPGGTARFGYLNSTVANPDLMDGAPVENPGVLTPVTKPTGGAPDAGNIKARMTVAVTTPSAFPSGASIQVYLAAYWYDRNGVLINTTVYAVIYPETIEGALSPTVMESNTGATPVDGACWMAFAAYAEFDDGIPAGTTVSFSGIEVWQEQSVFIGDGMIKAPLIEANAITTDKLDALAITAKHTITGALFQTEAPGTGLRVVIGPHANFMNQPGVRIFGQTGDIWRTANIFVADGDTGTATGGWDANQFAITGPNQDKTDDHRADLELKRGGGWSLHKTFVPDGDTSGVYGSPTTNEVLVAGTLPRETDLNMDYAAIRGINVSSGNGSVTWGVDNGWIYRMVGGPNTTQAGGAGYSSCWTMGSSGFSYHSGGGSVQEINFIGYRGGYLL